MKMDKIATAVGYCTSSALIFWGGLVRWLNNLDWNKVAVISGIIIGIATFIVNIWYKQQMLTTYRNATSRGIISPPGQEE